MAERRWVSREEIAELHETLAEKALTRYSDKATIDEPYSKEEIRDARFHSKAAGVFRYTDNLANGRIGV